MNTTALQTEAKKVIAAIHFDDVKNSVEDVALEASKTASREFARARRTMSRVATQVEKTAKANPLAAAGVLIGTGALLGALLHAALRPAPSLRDSFRASLKNLRR